MRSLFALLAIGATFAWAALLPAGAQAGTITSTISFVASDFVASGGHGAAPKDPVTGSFTITYDPTVAKTSETAGIHLNNLDINLGTTLAFDYIPSVGALGIGGLSAGVNGFLDGSDDFWLTMSGLTDHSFYAAIFGYSQVGAGGYVTSNVAMTIGAPVAATPIPASLPLLATCLAALGFCGFLRARRKPLGFAGLDRIASAA